MLTPLAGLALAAEILTPTPAAQAATLPSTVASLSAPNASGNPAPAPPTSAASALAAEGRTTPIPAPRGGSPAEQVAMAKAAAKAKASGTPVVVDALTSEVQQVIAHPNGTFSLAANAAPVRAKQKGGWVPIDTRLHKNADGTLSPNATAYGTVRFSGGGSTPLAVTSSGGTSYTLFWPTALPTPSVAGASATYPEVLPGVDLRVSATDTGGFSEVLIVKNPAAARNPALAKLTLPVHVGGGQLHPAAGGGFTLAGGANRYLAFGTALMWDSNTSLAAVNPSAAKKAFAAHVTLSPDPSDAGHAGLAARIATVRATAGAGQLTLTPDARLLTSPTAVFPEFIDPTVDWHDTTAGTPDYADREQGSPCNNNSFWDAAPQLGNTSEHALGIGHNLWSSCIGLMDPYFQWHLPSAINGAIINYATVKVTRNYSASCGSVSTATLHWSGGINSNTKWDTAKPTDLGHTVSATWPKNTGLNCSGGDIAEGFSLTSAVASNTYASQITVELESDADPSGSNGVYWYGNIQPNPTLQIEYNQPATVPINLSAVTGSDNVGCATNAPYPYMGKTLTTNTPILQAQVGDPDGGHVQAQFKYWLDGSSTTYTGLSADDLASGATAQYSLPSSFTSALTNGQVVDWQVQATDGGPYSAWSQTCHFTAEPTGPNAPTIPPNSTYPNTSTGGGVGASAGTPAYFTLTGAADGAPATSFVYGLDQPPATSNPPASQVATITGTTATGAQDRWRLNEGSGRTGFDYIGPHPVTLGSGATWVHDSVRSDIVMATNGTATGNATTTGPVLTTNASFSVSAWANLSTTGSFGDVVTQDGANNSGFFLQYSGSDNRWAMSMIASDAAGGAPGTRALSSAAPTTRAWTHLVGVYDATAQTLSLYVNGTLNSTVPFTSAWNAASSLALGRGKYAGSPTDFFPGEISDVQTYTRALTAADINTIYASATIRITPPSNGPHTLYVYARDAAGDVSGAQAYPLLAAGHTNFTCASFTTCLNNTAISDDTNPSEGHADGYNSFSATDLANAGWASGGRLAIDGAAFTLPTYGNASPDNVLAENQTIPITGPGNALSLLVTGTSANATLQADDPNYTTAPYVPVGTAIVDNYCFLGTNAQAPCTAAYGTLTYTDGTTSSYDLTVPDWTSGPASLAAVTLPHRNSPAGQKTLGTKIYDFTVPLLPGKSIASIQLPDLADSLSPEAAALHVFAMALRNNTTATPKADGTSTASASGTSWTGAWANPSEGQYNLQGSNFTNQTIRIAAKPSISGTGLRIKLDNALGTNVLDIGHVTIALDSVTANGFNFPTAQPAGPFTTLTFAGSTSTTIPAGGSVYSDPLASYPVTANQYLLISFTLTNSVPFLVEQTWANAAYEYVSAPGSGDQTTDTSGLPFNEPTTGTNQGWYTNLLTDLDVTTPGLPTTAMLGNGLIDAWQPNARPIPATGLRLSDDLAAAEPTTPYGLVDEGIESNFMLKDNPETYQGGAVGGPAALSRLDRDILDHPGITTVIVYEGLEDVLNGQNPNTLESAFNILDRELAHFHITPIYLTLPPCDGYPGGGGTQNDPCTPTVDANRQTLNAWIENANTAYNLDAAIGVPDTANGETELDPNASSDHVNLSRDGYGAVANALQPAQDCWALNDGQGGYAAAIATDGCNSTNPLNATLGGTYTWPTDPTRGTVLNLDGTTGYADAGAPALATTGSFTVSAWVNLASLPTHNAAVAAQDGTNASGFYLGYDYENANTPAWAFYFASTDTTNPSFAVAISSTAATGWTHLVGVYNAATRTADLYVNGTIAGEATGITPWNATGDLTIGRDRYNASPTDYFPGEISTLSTWNYALTVPQINALHDPIS